MDKLIINVKRKHSLILLLICPSIFSLTYAFVSLNIDGLRVTVKNNAVEVNFHSNATVSSVIVNGQNIVPENVRSFYLDWHDNGQAYFTPSELIIVENTILKAHFYWLQKSSAGVFRIELHYVMVDGLSGIYSWAKYTNDQSSNVTVQCTRTVYRFDPTILTQATNGVRYEQLYLYSYLENQTNIQDETWLLPNGTYYTKYDFAGYYRETPFQGVYGNGYGAFLISASREYHGGGPLRQDLLVHQDSLVLNVFVSEHLGTTGLTASPGWAHIYGPWLIYFNVGNDDEILCDVHSRAQIERDSWPYTFVNDTDYPTERGSISGQITGQKNASVLLHDSVNEDFDIQSLGYLFSTVTDSEGYFSIKNIRPGNYKLVAYPLAGQGSENLATKNVFIRAGDNEDVGSLNLPEPDNIIWSLGETNRRADEFRYSGELRNYIWSTLPPSTLTFTIAESNIANDWYYAQTKPGNWDIQYYDKNDETSRTLRIALAAASNNSHLTIYVNGYKISDIFCSNDHAIYRSAMQSGYFYSNIFIVLSDYVVSGINNLSLNIIEGEVMYDSISLQKNPI